MKYSETPDNLVKSRISYINERWSQLNSLFKDYSDHSLKYLFLTNAGGAAAVLSFLGASSDVRLLVSPKVALALFFLGLVISGILNASLVHRVDYIYREWRANVNHYYQDKIDWQELNALDDKIAWSNNKEFILGWSSLACFVLGGLVGIITLICN